MISKELQTYYEERFSMCSSKGWKDLIEDIQLIRKEVESIKGATTLEQLHFKKADIIYELGSQCKRLFKKDCKDMGLYLIRFNDDKGIVKCNHIEKENTIELLKSITNVSSQKVNIKTLGTSGTIKALTKKYMIN